ncbi:hypothetical protein LC087_19125 (plasmid) [Bacillus carboniphilus]|uniref:Uncharacterized protein n=1 Tax=Bacillus carboniphilus TaxID=86663 RepID=A0ABY9JYD3_9BACI|nr:hypothetical protein [Bacillus carboniphilus]WLR44421.1 hypothetical protein LC087_19125 [Bacillus carboniphilus]
MIKNATDLLELAKEAGWSYDELIDAVELISKLEKFKRDSVQYRVEVSG